MKRICYAIVLFLLIDSSINAQNTEYKLQNYHPSSPTAFEFLKYTEMPVSEYTGVPNISIPLYQIEEDGIAVPLNLTYHAGGIRVNQEASWVGLGWDLSIGSIVQEINDVDDYAPGTIRLLPDWNTSPVPQNFPVRYQYSCVTTLTPGYVINPPINPPQPFHSYMISTDFYAPINGNADNKDLGQALFSYPEYDSEPDMFTANFLGHSITFVRQFPNGGIVVLNKKGYTVTRTGDNYKIVVPSGEEYYFEVNSTVTSFSSSSTGLQYASTSSTLPSSRIWKLTKIITKNKRQIVFSYTQSSAIDNYPNYSDKWDKLTSGGSNVYQACAGAPDQVLGYSDLALGSTTHTISYSNENRINLTSISFPNGSITFSTSNRSDILGTPKLDAIQVTSSANQIVKSLQFNYNYFDATSVGGNTFQPYNSSVFGSTNLFRLKLLSLQDNSGATYSFSYNTNPLPAKNSLAQDFWGFYNGQITNTSLVPNPSRLKIVGLTDNNGNNNSANLGFIQSGILNEITYPTGGKVSFEYELNQFDNYWVPDFVSTTNTISSGNGVRVHAITSKSSDNTVSKRTIYGYFGGKGILPIDMYRHFTIGSLNVGGNSLTRTNYTIDELNGKGFFSTSALGSSCSVGYDKVVKQDVDANGVANGRIETTYNNTPDVISNSASGTSQLAATLPAIKKRDTPENGTTDSVSVFDNQNRLIRKIKNTYSINLSDQNVGLLYGARIFGYTTLYYGGGGSAPNQYWTSVPQTLIAYYPIYDKYSLLNSSITTEYDETNNSLQKNELFSYDGFDQVRYKQSRSSSNGYLEEYYNHAYDYYNLTGNPNLLNAHQYTDITNISIQKRKENYSNYTDVYKYNKDYVSLGDKVVVSQVTTNEHPGPGELPSLISFNTYDPSTGNLLEYTSKGLTNSMIWDYNGEYLAAEISNSNFQNTAATSFETEGKGNWTYSGNVIDDNSAPTGKKVYQLTGGNITKGGLDVSKTYIVSYWSKNGAQSVNGSTAISGRSLSGWTYYEHSVVNPINGVITVSGSGLIDELRLYPKGALMNTYTYAPLIGKTTECDANNKTQYYVYDVSNRLALILDQDKNVLKKFCYNYAGQIENCFSPCPPNSPADWQNTSTPPTCQQGNCGNTGYQLQEQKDMNLCSSTYNQVQNIQTYNTTACPLPTNITSITYQNSLNSAGFTATYTSRSNGQVYTFSIPASGSGVLGCLPTDSYNLSISKPGNMLLILFGTGCFTQSGTSANFGKVSISTCNTITLVSDLQ